MRARRTARPASCGLPTHLHITWQDENTLKVEADYGTQTRLFHFGPPQDQGRLDYSNATFFPPRTPRAGAAGRSGAERARLFDRLVDISWPEAETFERGGSLKVVTTRLKPGYYWKNGMPLHGQRGAHRILPRHGAARSQPVDPIYADRRRPGLLTQPWIVNYAFKKLPDGSKWNPTPCSVK